MTSATPDSAVSLAAPALPQIKLTPFCSIDAPTWFKRAEVQFRLKAESSATRRADHVLAALPDDIFPLLSEWLDEQGDTPIKYDDLKARLLAHFVPSPEDRADRLLHLSRQPLGDQRPSAAFTEMKALTRLTPAADGSPRKLDLLRILWLLRLPEHVRAGITDFTDATEAALLQHADDLRNASKAASRRPVFAATPDDTLPPPNDDDALAAAATRRFPGPNRSYPTPPSRRPMTLPAHQHSQPPRGFPPKRADSNSQLCFYHAKFGHAARNCRQPCSWPKNL